MNEHRFPELGFYAIPGHALSPESISEEITDAEELGIGSVWLAERFNTKDIGVISGMAAALSPNMGIASALIGNLPLRSPLVTASYAATMAKVTDNRFALGIGRGLDPLVKMTKTPRLTLKLLEDYIDIFTRLWRGEIVNYNGPIGNLANAGLEIELEVRPPIIMGAVGDKTCEWAGRHCDGVLLGSLWSNEAIAHSSTIIRRGAEQAGRDPDDVKIWTIQVTACETSEEDILNFVVRRMNTYLMFPKEMEIICKQNGWNLADADRLREELAKIDGGKDNCKSGLGDERTSRNLDDLRRMRDLYPKEWIYGGNAVGTVGQCASATLERLKAGADGILLHGSPPKKLAPLLNVWPSYRPAEKYTGRSVNPGL